MQDASRVTTRFPVESDLDAGVVKRLSDMINEVYGDVESGMWKRAGTRTDPTAVERLLRVGAFILAEIDGALVGSVHVSLVGEGVEFGMLAADPGRRGAGIGTALVRHAESWARQQGCRPMRLELLTPCHWKNPSKEVLTTWYARIGYAPQNTEPLERMYPNLVPELATDCDFTVWHNPLIDMR